MDQAREIDISHGDKAKAQSQASGLHYTKVEAEAKGQLRNSIFEPNVKNQLMAMKQAKGMRLRAADKRYAHRQAFDKGINKSDKAAAEYQATGPRYSLAARSEAAKLATGPAYEGLPKRFAQAQAELDLLTGKVTKKAMEKAKKQADDTENPKDMKRAIEQAASEKLNSNDMKFALRQANKMYGMSKKQAVDTITKLTAEVQLFALRQADDSLKKRDAARAMTQAKEMRLTLEEEMHAAQQAHDSKLEHLSRGTERYARKQTESEFAGMMTAENAAIAMKLAKNAEAKKRKFLSGYEQWEEERQEAAVRAKYEKQRQRLLGETGNVGPGYPGNVQKVVVIQKTVPSAKATPLGLDAFNQKLASIRHAADQDIAGIHHGAVLASSLAFSASGAVGGG